MLEIITDLKTWQKWTGGSMVFVILLIGFFYVTGNNEAAELPSTINEIKQNATEQVIDEGTKAGVIIVDEFHDVGVEMAKDIEDPLLRGEIVFLWTLGGFLLALAVILALLEAVGIKLPK